MRKSGLRKYCFSKYDVKCMEKFHSDGNTLTETSFAKWSNVLDAT